MESSLFEMLKEGKKVGALGSLNADYSFSVSSFPQPGSTVTASCMVVRPGGKSSNQIVQAALLGMDCLVLGFGRIGKLLSLRLSGLGAQVTATARTPEDLAWIRACGWKCLRTEDLDGQLAPFGVVFNTVPAPVLGESLLQQLPQHCLCVDLASRQGIDLAAAERLGLPGVWARSLPGRLKPKAAAEILRDAIHNILMEG